MPNKTVPGYTQVPVAAADILRVTHDRLSADGSVTQVTVTYQVRDNVGAGAVRAVREHSLQAGAYPVSGASVLSAVNTLEGT